MLRKLLALLRQEQVRQACSIIGLAQLVLGFFLLFAAPLLFADDCSRDWRRAED